MELQYFLDIGYGLAFLIVGIAIFVLAKSRQIRIIGVISILISVYLFFKLIAGISYTERAFVVDRIVECSVDEIKAFRIGPPISDAFQDKSLLENPIVFSERQDIEAICGSLRHAETTLLPVKEPYDWRAVIEMQTSHYTYSFLVLTRSTERRYRTVIEIRTQGVTGETIAFLQSNQLGKVLETLVASRVEG